VEEVQMLFKIIRDLKSKGVTIIYISHRLEELFEIGDRISVMRDGQYVTTLDVKQATQQELIAHMVGREVTQTCPPRDCKIGEEILRLENVCGNGDQNISFTLHRGEVLGFGGLVGAGRTELMEVIYGAAPLESGQIYYKGTPVKVSSPRKAIEEGIGLVPEDRKKKGVFLGQSIAWNTVINCLEKYCKGGLVQTKQINDVAEEFEHKFNIKTSSLDQMVKNLSGGNQQKVVLAKTMAANSEVIIFDEPTRGIDVGAKQEIYELMNELVSEGKAILMVSSDMPELLGMCDRIVVIAEGKQTGILNKDEFDQEKVLELASISAIS
jgi:ribose transport system ATP-binding protein